MNQYDISINPVLREDAELELLNDIIYNAEEARRSNVKRQMNVDHIFSQINRNHERYINKAVDVEYIPVTGTELVYQEARGLTGAWWLFGTTALAVTVVAIKVVLLLG